MRDWSFFPDKLQRQDRRFFASKTAVVIDRDKFQEILYQPMSGECIKEGLFGSGILKVNYEFKIVSEIAIDDIIDFT